MDYKKLQSLVNKGITIDVGGADGHEVRVNYKYGNDTAWLTFTPERYSSEEELAAVINTEVERKLHGKIKTSLD